MMGFRTAREWSCGREPLMPVKSRRPRVAALGLLIGKLLFGPVPGRRRRHGRAMAVFEVNHHKQRRARRQKNGKAPGPTGAFPFTLGRRRLLRTWQVRGAVTGLAPCVPCRCRGLDLPSSNADQPRFPAGYRIRQLIRRRVSLSWSKVSTAAPWRANLLQRPRHASCPPATQSRDARLPASVGSLERGLKWLPVRLNDFRQAGASCSTVAKVARPP